MCALTPLVVAATSAHRAPAAAVSVPTVPVPLCAAALAAYQSRREARAAA